jgi:hypothetical protein
LQALPRLGGATPTLSDLHRQEAALLTAVDHRLSLPTPLSFLRHYGSLSPGGAPGAAHWRLSRYLAELALLERSSLALLPSQVAAAAWVWALVLLQQRVDPAHVEQVGRALAGSVCLGQCLGLERGSTGTGGGHQPGGRGWGAGRRVLGRAEMSGGWPRAWCFAGQVPRL